MSAVSTLPIHRVRPGENPISTVAQSESVPLQNFENTLTKLTRSLLYEGSEKILYQTDRTEFLVMEFKSGTGAGRKRGKTKSMGAIRNDISSYLFEYIEGFQVNTHFVKQTSDVKMNVKRLDMIPIIVKIYNVSTGSIAKRFDVKEGTVLTFPIVEYAYRNRNLDLPWLNETHVAAFNLATPDEFRVINRLASKVNAVLRALCERRDLILATVSLEFGRHSGQILLGDELSPSTCLFWDKLYKTKADREKYRIDSTDAEETLAELSNIIRHKG
jgi:phosphoribosylaminoimidazole-succinocarboxamide synthase